MMMTRMAKKSDIGGYDCARPVGSRAPGRRKGGGVNPSSREVGGDGVEWMLG